MENVPKYFVLAYAPDEQGQYDWRVVYYGSDARNTQRAFDRIDSGLCPAVITKPTKQKGP